MNETQPGLPRIRQALPNAENIADMLGNTVEPNIRKGLEAHLKADEAMHGPLSLEFVHGFFSGLFYGHFMTTKYFNSDPGGALIAFTVIMAEEYVKRAEKQLPRDLEEK